MRSHPVARVILCGLVLAGAPTFAIAQSPGRAGVAAREAEIRAEGRAAEKARQERALRDIEARAAESDEAGRRAADEVAVLRRDRAALGAALVEAAARARAAEERIRSIEIRLETAGDSEAAIRASLESRQDLMAEVLAALQRMGFRAGPALLVRAGDMLAAVRTAMMLGLVVPSLREETERLSGDLRELGRLRMISAQERSALDGELGTLARERLRLGFLVRARQEETGSAEARLGAETARAEALGREARSLRDLVDRLDSEAGAARREAEETRRAAEIASREIRERFAAAAGRDAVRLAPRVAFGEARGLLARPAAGPTLREFGAPDGLGGTMRGIAIASRPRAVVTSPADGTVVFAGPFRSFGRLLILNVGGGYHLLAAGMDRISVEVGQFVLAGEPVGQMGDAPSASAALGAVEAGGPVLYVEFRKDGASIDPAPWWSRSQSEKVRG